METETSLKLALNAGDFQTLFLPWTILFGGSLEYYVLRVLNGMRAKFSKNSIHITQEMTTHL
jgi:hypothetical protein